MFEFCLLKHLNVKRCIPLIPGSIGTPISFFDDFFIPKVLRSLVRKNYIYQLWNIRYLKIGFSSQNKMGE